MATGKLRTPIKQQVSLDYQLGRIDEKLSSNEVAHTNITNSLDNISATLSDVKISISSLNIESALRIANETQMVKEVTSLCAQILPIQSDMAAIKNQINTDMGRLGILEGKITGVGSNVDTLKGKASLWGGIVGFIVSAVGAIVSWFVVHVQK